MSAAPDYTTPEDIKRYAIMHMSEREFHRRVVDMARQFGWRVFHDAATNHRRKCRHCGAVSSGPRNEAGFPDLLLVRGDRLIFVELKTLTGKITPAQNAWLSDLDGVPRVTAEVWRPDMLEQIRDEVLS